MPAADPVLLLHGQPGGARDWDRVIAALHGRAAPIAIDRPGWDGRTPASDLAGNGRAALAALDAHGAERATVVGHSMGGAVAAWIAAHRPERVTALVLAAPAANLASVEPVDRWLAAPVLGFLTGVLSLSALGLALSAAPLRRRVAGRADLEETYLRDAGRALLTPRAWRTFAAEQRSLLRELPMLEQSLARIAAPTTILSGSDDRIVPRRAAAALVHQIPDARLSELDGAGHLLPQRHAQALADAIVVTLSGRSTL